MWLLFLSAMTCGYMVYIYMTWFFTYLVEQRHLTQMASSYYTIGPFIAMAILTPIGGVASDLIARKITLRWGTPFDFHGRNDSRGRFAPHRSDASRVSRSRSCGFPSERERSISPSHRIGPRPSIFLKSTPEPSAEL